MNVYLEYLGCRLNQAEIQAMADGFERQGHRVSRSPAEADLIVLNTCAVTHEASRDSRQRLHRLHRLNPDARLVPTGCWATLHPQAAGETAGVWRVVENASKDSILALTPRPLARLPTTKLPSSGEGERRSSDLWNGVRPEDISPASPVSPSFPSSREPFDLDPLERNGLPGARLRTRLFVKVQDGCDNHCAFCVTRIARGPERSRPLADMVNEINLALASGVKEIVLTGVHLGSYGHDFGDRRGLFDLVQTSLRETDVQRLRLSSLEPWDLCPEFFDLWPESNGRLCRHLHLPLQSGSAATLRRMARRTTPDKFAALVAVARERIPEVAISTDVIAGFPGETEREFDETLSFVRAMNFSDLHVFKYSPREGTKAATMRGQVPEPEKKDRSRRLRELGEASARAYRSRFIGRALPVLWEATDAAGPEGWRWQGYTDNYLRVRVTSREMLWNTVTKTRLESYDGESMVGLLSASTPSQEV